MSYCAIAERWKEKNIRTVQDLDTTLSNYQVLFAYHSNRIENAGVSLHDTREIFENGRITNYTGSLRNLFETQNQKVCYDWLKKKIISKETVVPELISEAHELLMHGCYDETRWSEGERPGTYKKHMYGVGLSAGLAPEDVPREMEFICSEIRNAPDEWSSEADQNQILTAAVFFHCNLEYIHPFADGNGRVGRTMMNYFLMIHDMPPAVIFDEDRKLYYEVFTVFDELEKLDGFVQFLKEETVKTWEQKRRLPSSGTIKNLLML